MKVRDTQTNIKKTSLMIYFVDPHEDHAHLNISAADRTRHTSLLIVTAQPCYHASNMDLHREKLQMNGCQQRKLRRPIFLL